MEKREFYRKDGRKESTEHSPRKPLDLSRGNPKETNKARANKILNHDSRVPRYESNIANNEIAPRPSCDDELAQAIKVIREGASYDWFPRDKDTQLRIEQLDKTLQDWNRHVEKTLKEHNQHEAPDKYRLDYEIQDNELKISNGDGKSLLSLPLKKDTIERFDHYLQNRKEHSSMEETIKEVEKIGLSASIDKTLQDWNRRDIPDTYRLSSKDTVKAVNCFPDITASSLKKFFSKCFERRTGELKKRAAFDKLYEEARSKLPEVTNDSSRLQGLDRTNHADSDLYPVLEKRRSKEIITRLKSAIKKFDSDGDSLFNFYITEKQRLNENEMKDIRRLFEESDFYKNEMQKRREFDERETIKSAHLEQSLHDENQIYQAFENLKVDDNKELESEMQMRQFFEISHKGRLEEQTKIKVEEDQRREIFDEKLEGLIKERFPNKRIEEKQKILLKLYADRRAEIASGLQKEIEQIKKLEDYRRARKDS